MKNDQMVRFLAQFEASKKVVSELPAWMRNTANIASASLPQNKSAERDLSTESRPKQKR